MTDGLSPAVQGRAAPAPRPTVSTRTAGRALYVALATVVLSMVALALYFGGAGDMWGPVNDVLVATSVALVVPAMLAVRRLSQGRAGTWLSILTLAAIAGALVLACGQLALVTGVIGLEASFATGTLGVLPMIAWLAGTGVLALRTGLLARSVGWWAAAFVAIVIVTALGLATLAADTPTLALLFGAPLLVALAGWMLSLGRDLERRAPLR